MKKNSMFYKILLLCLVLVNVRLVGLAVPEVIPLDLSGDFKLIIMPIQLGAVDYTTITLESTPGASIGLLELPGINKIIVPSPLKEALNSVRFQDLKVGGSSQLIILRGVVNFMGSKVPIQIRVARKGLSKEVNLLILRKILGPKESNWGFLPQRERDQFSPEWLDVRQDSVEDMIKGASIKGSTYDYASDKTKKDAATGKQETKEEKPASVETGKEVSTAEQKKESLGRRLKGAVARRIEEYDWSILIGIPLGLKLSNLTPLFKPIDSEIVYGMIGLSTGAFEDGEWGAISRGVSLGLNIRALGIIKKMLDKVGSNLNEVKVSGSIMPGWYGSSLNVKIPGRLSMGSDVETTGLTFSMRMVQEGVPPATVIAPAVAISTGLKIKLSEPLVINFEIEAAPTSMLLNGWMDGMVRIPHIPVKLGDFRAIGKLYYDTAATVIGIGGLGFGGAIQVGRKRLDLNMYLAAKEQLFSGEFVGGLYLSDVVSLVGDIVQGDFKNIGKKITSIQLPEDIPLDQLGSVVAATKQAEQAFKWVLANPDKKEDIEYIFGAIEDQFVAAGLTLQQAEEKIKVILADVRNPKSEQKKPEGKINDWGIIMKKYVPDIGVDYAKAKMATGPVRMGDQFFAEGFQLDAIGMLLGAKLQFQTEVTRSGVMIDGYLQKLNLGPITITGAGPDKTPNTADDGAMFRLNVVYPADLGKEATNLALGMDYLMRILQFQAYLDGKVTIPVLGTSADVRIDLGPTKAAFSFEASLLNMFKGKVAAELDLTDPMKGFLEVGFEQDALDKLSKELMKAAKIVEGARKDVGKAKDSATKALNKAKKDAEVAIKKAADYAAKDLKNARSKLDSAKKHLQKKKDGLSRDQDRLRLNEDKIKKVQEKLNKCFNKISKTDREDLEEEANLTTPIDKIVLDAGLTKERLKALAQDKEIERVEFDQTLKIETAKATADPKNKAKIDKGIAALRKKHEAYMNATTKKMKDIINGRLAEIKKEIKHTEGLVDQLNKDIEAAGSLPTEQVKPVSNMLKQKFYELGRERSELEQQLKTL